MDSYPFLAMIGKVSGQLEVLCIVLGTGAVTNPISLTLDDITFPPLNLEEQNIPSSAQPPVTGSLKPDVIVAELWQAYTNYMELLAPEFEAETARLTRQRVREEQEAAYRESLRQDQLKVSIVLSCFPLNVVISCKRRSLTFPLTSTFRVADLLHTDVMYCSSRNTTLFGGLPRSSSHFFLCFRNI